MNERNNNIDKITDPIKWRLMLRDNMSLIDIENKIRELEDIILKIDMTDYKGDENSKMIDLQDWGNIKEELEQRKKSL